MRKELSRLREVAKKEKEKPENAGKTVMYDHNSRRVLVNHVVVDHFHANFF